MNRDWDRRSFLGLGLAGLAVGRLHPDGRRAVESAAVRPAEPTSDFPQQDRAVVREMVAVSHGNFERARELVAARPALARASIDWGFGDWEDALGAASHTGSREIAELLLFHGARPTIFSAAMLGQLNVVTAFVAASPGIQRTLGPHSITLLAHAKAGGHAAEPVGAFLDQLGDADPRPAVVALSAEERRVFYGIYGYGTDPVDRLEVADSRGAVAIRRVGGPTRGLHYIGNQEFVPVGAESVRVRFTIEGGTATLVEVYDPALLITGRRVA